MYSMDLDDREYMQVHVKQNSLFKRFETGEIGKKYESVMNSEEIKEYIKENVDAWLKDKLNKINLHPLAEIGFKQMTSKENIGHFIVAMIFVNALEIWTDKGGNLEGIILEMISTEKLKKDIDMFQKNMNQLIAKINLSLYMRNNDEYDNDDYGYSDDDYEYESIYYMPYSEGSGRLN